MLYKKKCPLAHKVEQYDFRGESEPRNDHDIKMIARSTESPGYCVRTSNNTFRINRSEIETTNGRNEREIHTPEVAESDLHRYHGTRSRGHRTTNNQRNITERMHSNAESIADTVQIWLITEMNQS